MSLYRITMQRSDLFTYSGDHAPQEVINHSKTRAAFLIKFQRSGPNDENLSAWVYVCKRGKVDDGKKLYIDYNGKLLLVHLITGDKIAFRPYESKYEGADAIYDCLCNLNVSPEMDLC